MFKIDHRKTLKPLYHPSSKVPAIVEIPPMNFLMVDGHGKPDGKQFPQAASILYPLAYTLKWMVRLGSDIDFHVMPMEVLWKVNREKKEFAWTMMLMQPEYVTAELVTEARQKVQSKVDLALLEKVRFEAYAEGMCVHFLHIGPYEGMDAALDKMWGGCRRTRLHRPGTQHPRHLSERCSQDEPCQLENRHAVAGQAAERDE